MDQPKEKEAVAVRGFALLRQVGQGLGVVPLPWKWHPWGHH